MIATATVNALAQQIDALLPGDWRDARAASYDHMGAIIADAGLQAGLKYESVVLPRVRRLVHFYPMAATTRGFIATARVVGLEELLAWSHPRKMQRISELADALFRGGVDTVGDLREWLAIFANASSLLQIDGVGHKTVDYLRKLAGLQAIPVDRHLRRFARSVGFEPTSYDELARMYVAVADRLRVAPSLLDSAIWRYARLESRPALSGSAPKSAPPARSSRRLSGRVLSGVKWARPTTEAKSIV